MSVTNAILYKDVILVFSIENEEEVVHIYEEDGELIEEFKTPLLNDDDRILTDEQIENMLSNNTIKTKNTILQRISSIPRLRGTHEDETSILWKIIRVIDLLYPEDGPFEPEGPFR